MKSLRPAIGRASSLYAEPARVSVVMAISRRILLFLFLLPLAACASKQPAPQPSLDGKQTDTANAADAGPLQRAEALFTNGDFTGARVALEEDLDDEDADPHARYLLARALGFLGEYRGARAQLFLVLEELPDNTLAWDLLAMLHEQLGEHRAAIQAYAEVQRRTESISPLLGIARCYLYLGDPQAALASLESARNRPGRDPWAEFLAYQALRRLGRENDSEAAARSYLDVAATQEAHAERMSEVRRWLASRVSLLPAPVRQTMMDYVRAACRLRLPSSKPPEEAVLARAPQRLMVHDDRPVFVTLHVPETGKRHRGHGRGRNLANALKGAVDALHRSPAFMPLETQKAAVRIDIGRELEPLEVQAGAGGLVARPGFERGVHGLALRADGAEVFCLPGDPISEDLSDLEACLDHAVKSGGLAPSAWKSATNSVFRFESEAFLSLEPGSSPVVLVGSEPPPLPEPTLASLDRALRSGGRWLTTLLEPDGSLVASYSPPHDAFAPNGADDPSPVAASPAATARCALAFSVLRGINKDKVQAAAVRHLTEALLGRLGRLEPSAEATRARAWLLLALAEDPTTADTRERLAAEVSQAQPTDPETRAACLRALAAHGRSTGQPRWRAAALDLRALTEESQDRADAELRLAGLRLEPLPSETSRILKWATRQLELPAPADLTERCRWLSALARASSLAETQGHEDAVRLRATVVEHARSLLVLQLDERHRYLCKAPERALGGFRANLGSSHLEAQLTAECVLALAEVRDLLLR